MALQGPLYLMLVPSGDPVALPDKVNAIADKIVGWMVSGGIIIAVVALIAAFVMLFVGEEGRGSGGGKIIKVLFGVAGVMAAGSIIGLIVA